MKSHEELRAAIMPHVWADGLQEAEENIDAVVDLIRKIIREDLMGLFELKARLGIKASAANMRTWRGSAPRWAGRIANGRIWWRPDVEDWIAENPKAVRHHDAQEAS
jgi:hypothetical protein